MRCTQVNSHPVALPDSIRLNLSRLWPKLESHTREVIHMVITSETPTTTAQRIAAARSEASLSQRELADRTGIPQATICRIEKGRPAKMNEILLMASALGTGVAELTGHSDIRDRVECAARASDGSAMTSMKAELLRFLELDAYLENQGIALQA